MTELVAGVDSSTQSCKIELRALRSGAVVARGSSPHPPTTPPQSEQHPDDWWAALVRATAELGSHREDVVAVSVAAQQHGLVLLDVSDRVVRPAILWNDTRAAPQAHDLVERLGPERWAAACGSVPRASFTVAKLAWMADEEPDALAAATKVMLPHDYLTWRLSGEHVTDRGDASGTGWWDPATGAVQIDLLDAATGGAGETWATRAPRVLGPTDVAGTLGAEAAADLGLRPGIPVGPGTGDNMAAALGLGLAPGDVAMSLGTSGTVYAVSAGPTRDETGAVAGFAGADGGFLPLVCTLNATKVTDAVGRWTGRDANELAALACQAPAGSDGVVVVPYFDGERTPDLPEASGWFSGLRSDTSTAALARAAHEGVVCGLLDGLDAIAAADVDTSGRLHLVGGGAHSAAYRRVVADLRSAPVNVPDDNETVATGACVQAAMAVGEDLEGIGRDWSLGQGTEVEPVDGADAAEVRARYRDVAAHVAGG